MNFIHLRYAESKYFLSTYVNKNFAAFPAASLKVWSRSFFFKKIIKRLLRTALIRENDKWKKFCRDTFLNTLFSTVPRIILIRLDAKVHFHIVNFIFSRHCIFRSASENSKILWKNRETWKEEKIFLVKKKHLYQSLKRYM